MTTFYISTGEGDISNNFVGLDATDYKKFKSIKKLLNQSKVSVQEIRKLTSTKLPKAVTISNHTFETLKQIKKTFPNHVWINNWDEFEVLVGPVNELIELHGGIKWIPFAPSDFEQATDKDMEQILDWLDSW